MDKVLQGKTAIVAGGGQGIGQASALALAQAGAAIVVLDINDAGLADTANRIEHAGGRCLPQRCDITRRDQVDAAIALAAGTFGSVDILFNSAMLIRAKPLEEQTEADLLDVLKVNLFGPFNAMQACFPYLKQRGGKIINCGSASGTMGVVLHSTYAAAKEGVRGLTKSAANEWGQYGINVNAIMPLALTPSARADLGRAGDLDAQVRQIASHIPMRRFGDPARDIAPVVVFLASPASDYISGRSLFVDGGGGSFL
ncbi:MAG: 3-oxoacyl-(acyl-carrier-protein) reductase [Hydrocarboniphaga sp.]|uniref:SDR family NAD(P)-dependent oxidoreductase n=1 Tax=Hydrocarboniphaga sp. TaxID=2033016 RepID=UPI0026145CFD|nr:SDR family oxidoreductase [Hydrocarboniphaga sp.]MDB5971387.1 3-oxoacyl-(acyl-carrier-protein) reductase [Hydrocarboniphaga sp.]